MKPVAPLLLTLLLIYSRQSHGLKCSIAPRAFVIVRHSHVHIKACRSIMSELRGSGRKPACSTHDTTVAPAAACLIQPVDPENYSASTNARLDSDTGFAHRGTQVFLLPEYLAITMEYAAGGDLFQLVGRAGGLREEDAKWYFQQIIVAIDYCHRMVRAALSSRKCCHAIVKTDDHASELPVHVTRTEEPSNIQGGLTPSGARSDCVQAQYQSRSAKHSGTSGAGCSEPRHQAGKHPARRARAAAADQDL